MTNATRVMVLRTNGEEITIEGGNITVDVTPTNFVVIQSGMTKRVRHNRVWVEEPIGTISRYFPILNVFDFNIFQD
jgi:hypothetical protein